MQLCTDNQGKMLLALVLRLPNEKHNYCCIMAIVAIMTNFDDNECWIEVQCTCSSIQLFECNG